MQDNVGVWLQLGHYLGGIIMKMGISIKIGPFFGIQSHVINVHISDLHEVYFHLLENGQKNLKFLMLDLNQDVGTDLQKQWIGRWMMDTMMIILIRSSRGDWAQV